MERNLDDLTTDELLAVSRASEAQANVFRGLARRDDRYSKRLQEVEADAAEVHAKLLEQGIDPSNTDPVSTVPDKEGTAPSLADGFGNYADDAHVANIGGIGIEDSNTNPDEALQEIKDRADPEVIAERAEQVKAVEQPRRVPQTERVAQTMERAGVEREAAPARERLPKRNRRAAAKAAERETA